MGSVEKKLGEYTHEEVIGIWIRSPDFEEFHQIMKLAVYVSANSHGAFLQAKINIKS
jgi:hypothetical protein